MRRRRVDFECDSGAAEMKLKIIHTHKWNEMRRKPKQKEEREINENCN
jgi:hypothetical protein